MQNLRNIAIIAHVDHGKTTLLDNLLKQSGVFAAHENVAERVMDSDDLEKEHGITIFSKHVSLLWKNVRINIIDSPGHVDFSAEVERIMSMVDGVMLLVDALEGVMPQTKYVLGKALKIGLKPIVVINKVDRADALPKEIESEIWELFISLDATDEQANFPIIYASGKDGWATRDIKKREKDLSSLFDLILEHVPEPKLDLENDFSMLIAKREYDYHLGFLLTGRISSGSIQKQQLIKTLDKNNKLLDTGKVIKLLVFRGIKRLETDETVCCGDIVVIAAGTQKANVGDTICALTINKSLTSFPIDPPTISINFSVNDSPLAGTEGNKIAYSAIRDRLTKEAESNIAIQVAENAKRDSIEVAGRGELLLALLIEKMRKEGFELSIKRPQVIIKIDSDGRKKEPFENIYIESGEEFIGTIIESMGHRKAEVQEMIPMRQTDKTRLHFIGPTRGLIGYARKLHTDTKGTATINTIFRNYQNYCGPIDDGRKGALISTSDGKAVTYALFNLADRGKMFVNPGDKVYEGMIVGEHNRSNDLGINVSKTKQLTNMRTSSSDETIRLSRSAVTMTLEEAITYIKDDECVEVTPKNIRLRKIILNPNLRKRAKD